MTEGAVGLYDAPRLQVLPHPVRLLPLTDPELDLLRELLSDDPTDSVYLQVGEELIRRSHWDEAIGVLRAGLAGADVQAAWSMLARASLETANYEGCLAALSHAGPEQRSLPALGHIHILALERAGKVNEAREAVARFEHLHGHDAVTEAVKERIEAPPPDTERSAHDPFLTVRRAERYASIGRSDRAIRIYRRILFRYPDDIAIRTRLLQLDHQEHDVPETADLSEELADPNLVPPDLTMPMPAITSASVEPAPTRGREPKALREFMASSREAQRRQHLPQLEEDDDADGPTDELPGLAEMGLSTGRKRRRRRSLLKR